ncbi:MAG: polynucleotide adenylyltransferase PcnB, partial [Gammaproteobacteria bacterium]
GYKAYLVGGGVRDLLLNLKPKDFDVVTDARPEQIRELFRNSRLIGRRFRLAHVRYGNEVIEVSTFRAEHHAGGEGGHSENGRIIRDNVYGDIDEDAWRRDFTINALFYNIADFSLVDYVGGLDDIRARQLRLIGNPEERYREDPVRMLRAVRFAAKLGFALHPATEQSMRNLDYLVRDVPTARLFEEFMKFFMTGHALASYRELRRHELFAHLCAETGRVLDEETGGITHNLLVRVFTNTDTRLAAGKTVNPGFLLAALLWASLMRKVEDYKSNGLAEMDAMALASDAVISRQVKTLSMPRRFTHAAREIWGLQSRLKHRNGKRPFRLLSHPRFRAGYDFLQLRAEAGENVCELATWWTEFVAANSSLLEETAVPAAGSTPPGRRKRRRSGRH